MTGNRRPTNMEHQITLRVRPGESVRFPALCVACGRPAAERLTLQRKRGQITRRVDAPLCADCARRLARRSGEEERLIRLSRLAAVGVAISLAALVFLVLPFGLWLLRLVAGAMAGLVAGALVYRALARRAAAAELPERRAVRESARIVDFDWREMTLAFADPDIAERVREMNPSAALPEALPADDGAGIEHETVADEPAPPADE